ncbi:hypothetical protein [Actinophytocola sp. KF-1]
MTGEVPQPDDEQDGPFDEPTGEEPDEPLADLLDETDRDDEVPDVDDNADRTGGIGTVRGNRNISITDPRGSVVVMEQVAFHLRSAVSDSSGAPEWSPRLVPEDILNNLAERFEMPPGYGDLVRRLRYPGTVVVSGAPGCGRRSAALMVLKESGEGATRFRELPDDDVGDRLILDASVIEPGERLLLDLTTEWKGNPQDLRAYRAAVAEHEAYLAIVLPPERHQMAAELGIEAVFIERPDGAAVFRKHLSALGIEVAPHELNDEALRGHLARDPMRDIAALAERVRRARNHLDGRGGWSAWLAAALKTDTYVKDVAQYVRAHPDGRERALLLAAALFEHAAPEVVASAATTFLEIVKYPPHDSHRLDLPDLAEALDNVHATIDGRQVRFASVAYADAVRTHFWRTFPDLRGKLRHWLDRSVRSAAVPIADRSLAVLRYTDQCLRVGHPEDLQRLVEQWAARSPSTPDKLLDIAGAALTRGLLDERYGRWFRRRVYNWVLDHRLLPSLATLLIGLCEEVIAPAQPGQALVRLRHLTRHTTPGVVADARSALARLCRDGRFARRMLTRVHDDLVGDHRRDVDFALFTDVADPVRLTGAQPGYPRVGERVVSEMLVDGWAAWLAMRPYQDVAAAVTPWLAAHADEPGRDALLDILAAATRGLSPRCAVLYVISRDWVATATPDQRRARLHTAALLRHACAEVRSSTPSTHEARPAQGVRP